MTRPGDPGGPARPVPWAVLAALSAAGLHLRTVWHGWAFDDAMEVLGNAFIQSWDHLGRLLTTTAWTGSGMETHLWRPVTSVSFLLNHTVSGLEPWSYHLVNVVLNAAVAALVVRLGLRWGLPAAAAGIGGVLFALHPAFVEVVAPASGRKDLLATLFILVFVLSHPRARQRGGRWTALAVVALAGAALSKETGFMALPLLAAVEMIRSRSTSEPFAHASSRALWACYALTVAGLWVARWSVTGGATVSGTEFWDNPLVDAGPWSRTATALTVVGRGVATLLLPLSLSPDYSFDAIPLVTSPLDPRPWAVAVLLGAPALAAWRLRRGAPWLGLAVAWYALGILPASNLLALTGTIYGERLLYLPGIAVCLAAGATAHALGGRHRRASVLLVTAAGGMLAFQSFRYAGAWRGDIPLFEWAVRAEPSSTKAHHKLGEEYLRVGRTGDALASLSRALAIAPDNRWAAATREQAVTRAVAGHPEVLQRPMGAALPTDPRILHVLGQQLRGAGDLQGARRLLEAAVAADPAGGHYREELGVILLQQGDTAGAVRELEAAARGAPELVTPWFTLGRIHLSRGDATEGYAALDRFVRLAGRRWPRETAWARELLARRLP